MLFRFTTPKPISQALQTNFYLFIVLMFCMAACINNSSTEDLETDDVDKAMHQEFLMTRDLTLNAIPKERLLVAMDYLRNARTYSPSNLTWTERGPNNIGGRTRAIMIDKRDASGNTVFAASVSGGIFKTTNFTSAPPTWTVVDDQMSNLAVTVLLQDRNNPNIMYAGTGEGWFNIDAVRGGGIFKSTNGGTTWAQIPSTSGFEFVQDMVQDNNGNLYVSLRNQSSSNRGVMRSIDGGTTWTQVLGLPLAGFNTGRAADLEVATNGDVYATLGIFTRTEVWKSSFATNGANTGALGTWMKITPTTTNPNVIWQRAELAVAPSNSQRVYLLVQDSATQQVQSFYRSFDGGTTWDSLGAPSALNNGGASQTWYNLIMAVDSTNADVIIVGGLNLTRSTDAGSSWTTISSGGSVHVDQHALVFFNSQRLLIGNDGGIYYSADVNNTTPTYANKNNGYNVTQFYGCDYHPTDANYFLAGAQDNNTQKFTQAGMNTTNAVVGGDGGFPHIRHTDGVIQIAATTGNNYYRSQNSGATFASLGAGVNNNRGQFINPTDFDDNLNALFCGDDAGQYYCIIGLDVGGTPTGSIKSVPAMASREVTAVKVDPVESNTIWIGASLGGQVPQVLKISTATATPTVSVNSTIPVAANAYISSIDVDPANNSNILVTLSNYGIVSVWYSNNGGFSWTNIEGNLPDMPVRWGLFAPSTAILSGSTGGGILLGTELGVWTTSQINGATTAWIANNSGFPNVRTDMLKYRPGNAMVVAATHGRGLFTTILPGVTTGLPNNTITKDFIKYISASSSQLQIVKGSLLTQKMQVQIFDVNGKMVYGSQHPYQNLSIPISSWPKGSYSVRINGNNKEYFVRQFLKN
ncbi:MAG: hypothetical protein C4308_01675 [Chitinophagaceae bacterium]